MRGDRTSKQSSLGTLYNIRSLIPGVGLRSDQHSRLFRHLVNTHDLASEPSASLLLPRNQPSRVHSPQIGNFPTWIKITAETNSFLEKPTTRNEDLVHDIHETGRRVLIQLIILHFSPLWGTRVYENYEKRDATAIAKAKTKIKQIWAGFRVLIHSAAAWGLRT